MADTPSDTAPTPTEPASGTESPATSRRPDLGKRVLAAVIDAVIAAVVGLVPLAGGIAATAY